MSDPNRLDDTSRHLLRTARFFSQLRSSAEFRACDVRLLLADGTFDHMHSAVASAHSTKFSQLLLTATLPITLNLSMFPPIVVRQTVDWLYNGNITESTEDVVSLLRTSHFLGFHYLHRKLELFLREVVREGSELTWALNTATLPEAGVSADTCKWIVRWVGDNEVSMEAMSGLRVPGIVALLSANVEREVKAKLLNIAIDWLKEPGRSGCIEHVVSQLYLPEMVHSDAAALRDTLTLLLKAPNTRDGLRVELGEDGYRIKMNPVATTTTSVSSLTTTAEVTEMTEEETEEPEMNLVS